MLSKKEEILTRALERERKAKEIAEGIIKSRLGELYDGNISLSESLSLQAEFQKNLIDNLVDALIVFDFDMNILRINNEALKLIGIHKTKAPTSINQFRPKYKEKIKELFNTHTFTKENNTVQFLFDFVNRKRELKYVSIKASVLRKENDKPHAYQTIIRDITKEHLLELKLKEQQNVLRVEGLILKDLLVTNDVFENGNALVRHIADYLGTDDCVFYAILGDKLIQIAATGQKLNKDLSIKKALEIEIGNGIVGNVALTKKSIIIKDTRENKDYIIDDENRLSEISVPILLDGVLVGIIDAEHSSENYFKKQQLAVLEKISNLIAVNIKNSLVILENSKKQIEIEKTQSRLKVSFESDLDAKAMESNDGFIEQISIAFLNLFNIPESNLAHFIGMDCQTARTKLKTHFVKEDSFSERVEEIISNEEVVLDEILELKDGRILSRNYNPVFINGIKTAQIWNYRDVSLQSNYDKSLAFQNKKYKGIIENMNIGLMEVDNNDVILNVNNAFIKMCGFSSKELLGNMAKNILLDKESQKLMKSKNKSRTEGLKDLYELEIIHKNSEKRYWLISGAPNTNINGEIIGSIGIHLDVTEFKKLNIKADTLITDLTVRNEELSHYAHIVSHDLKTPLRTISTCVNWLLEDNKEILEADSLGYITTVEEAINDMDKLISSTLQYSEIRTSKAEAVNSLKLGPVLDTIKTLFANNESKDFTINIVKPLPEVNLTEVKAKQIFQNLIENAYKYRDPEKNSFVTIDYEEHPSYYKFSVQDNGIGIDTQYHDIVFEALKKLNSRTDSSGFGLFIIKKIITSEAGEIWLDSEIGVGTTFYFTLMK